MGMFSLFGATPIVHKLGVKTSLIVGSICFVIWIGITIVPMVFDSDSRSIFEIIYISSMLGGIVLGFGSALIWVANGKQLKDVGQNGYGSFYNGLFWGIFSVSIVVANILGAWVVDKAGVMAVFVVGTGIAILSVVIMGSKFD